MLKPGLQARSREWTVRMLAALRMHRQLRCDSKGGMYRVEGGFVLLWASTDWGFGGELSHTIGRVQVGHSRFSPVRPRRWSTGQLAVPKQDQMFADMLEGAFRQGSCLGPKECVRKREQRKPPAAEIITTARSSRRQRTEGSGNL